MGVKYIDLNEKPKNFEEIRKEYEKSICSRGITLLPVSGSRYIAIYECSDFDNEVERISKVFELKVSIYENSPNRTPDHIAPI